jgi:hypothetical protein
MGVSINETAAEVGILFFETLAHPPAFPASLPPSNEDCRLQRALRLHYKSPTASLWGANLKIIFLWTIATLDP